MSAETYRCPRCGAGFGIAGESVTDEDREADARYDEQIAWHESGQCTPPAPATPLDRARVLVESGWDDEEPSVVATALLAIAEEQRTANLIALLALPAPAKSALGKKVHVPSIAELIVGRLGLGEAA